MLAWFDKTEWILNKVLGYRGGQVDLIKNTTILYNATAYELGPKDMITAGVLKTGKVSDIQLWNYTIAGQYSILLYKSLMICKRHYKKMMGWSLQYFLSSDLKRFIFYFKFIVVRKKTL